MLTRVAVAVLTLCIWGEAHPHFAQTIGSTQPQFAVSTDRFELLRETGEFTLRIQTPSGRRRAPVPREWLIPTAEADESEIVVSSFNYSREVTSFPIGNGKLGLHLSSFEAMKPGEGSMQAGAGRDVFLIYDPASDELRQGLWNLGITKERIRDEGCFTARMVHFVIGDVNQDGLTDIGAIREEIACDRKDDRVTGQFFKQHPVEWYLYRGPAGWEQEATPLGYADQVTELPLIGMALSPVDFVAYGLWKSFDPRKWMSQPRFIPDYRKKLVPGGSTKKPTR